MRYPEIEERDVLVEKGLLRCDDLDDLRVYSYINNCKEWDDITLNSRGVIYNRKTGERVALPFPKFFNMDQRVDTQERNLPWHGGFRIFDKEDGWLGTLFRHAGEHKIATRGSFKSPGAIWATEFLKRYDLGGLPDEVTLVFELICPITRIVVDYGDMEDLILLSAYNRHTGEEYDWDEIEFLSKKFGLTLVNSYDRSWLGACRGKLKTVPGNEQEGFVIRFNNGLRVKIKSEDYFRRHHLLSKLTPLVIWNNMSYGKVPQGVWDEVDVEYHDKLTEIARKLESQYEDMESDLEIQFYSIGPSIDRKTFAAKIRLFKHKAAMFALLDEHFWKVDNYIMGLIRPDSNVL